MSYLGHCNCKSIHITLPEQPANSLVCHCDCCKRAGGGGSSVNYPVAEDDMNIGDPEMAKKIYHDGNTASGNVIERHFCSSCGSPLFSTSPKFPGKIFLKAPLFDTIAPSGGEVYTEKRLQL